MASKRTCIQYNVRGTWVNDLKKPLAIHRPEQKKKRKTKNDTAAHLPL